MKEKKNILFLIVPILTALLLIGAIVATALLSKGKNKEWEYISAEEKLDYGAANDDRDFQYLANFRSAFTGYFDVFFGEFFSSYVNLKKIVSSRLEPTADKLVAAMEEARIPAQKLNKLAQALKNNSPSGVFNRLKEEFSQIADIDELQKYLEEKIGDMSLLSLICNFTADFMRETTLTENEIADICYYYLKQNKSETYYSYLELLGKDYFVSLVSNTVYVMATVNDMWRSDYLTGTTVQSIRTVLYQLGSIYSTVISLPGGEAAIERVIGVRFECDPSVAGADKIIACGEAVNGKIAELLAVIGCFMKSLSKEDVNAYCAFLSENDERKKSDLRICCAARFAKVLNERFDEINGYCKGRYETIGDMANEYVKVNDALGNFAFSVFENAPEDVRISKPENYGAYLNGFAEAVNILCKKDVEEETLAAMDVDSEEYKALKTSADDIFGIENGIMGIADNLFTAKISNKMYDIVMNGGKK